MIVCALVLVSLAATAGLAEIRRARAERERDALRADAIRLLLRADDLLGEADRLGRAYHGSAPGWVTLSDEPWGEDIRGALSAVDRAHRITTEGLRLLDRR